MPTEQSAGDGSPKPPRPNPLADLGPTRREIAAIGLALLLIHALLPLLFMAARWLNE